MGGPTLKTLPCLRSGQRSISGVSRVEQSAVMQSVQRVSGTDTNSSEKSHKIAAEVQTVEILEVEDPTELEPRWLRSNPKLPPDRKSPPQKREVQKLYAATKKTTKDKDTPAIIDLTQRPANREDISLSERTTTEERSVTDLEGNTTPGNIKESCAKATKTTYSKRQKEKVPKVKRKANPNRNVQASSRGTDTIFGVKDQKKSKKVAKKKMENRTDTLPNHLISNTLMNFFKKQQHKRKLNSEIELSDAEMLEVVEEILPANKARKTDNIKSITNIEIEKGPYRTINPTHDPKAYDPKILPREENASLPPIDLKDSQHSDKTAQDMTPQRLKEGVKSVKNLLSEIKQQQDGSRQQQEILDPIEKESVSETQRHEKLQEEKGRFIEGYVTAVEAKNEKQTAMWETKWALMEAERKEDAQRNKLIKKTTERSTQTWPTKEKDEMERRFDKHRPSIHREDPPMQRQNPGAAQKSTTPQNKQRGKIGLQLAAEIEMQKNKIPQSEGHKEKMNIDLTKSPTQDVQNITKMQKEAFQTEKSPRTMAEFLTINPLMDLSDYPDAEIEKESPRKRL
ncbi:glutamic acid-rich protein-like [Ambystoma mexicanum]|uniref:glutamic acid-rich protein-like n=1 Tax=Ambystoma mexicanum TaxID=8296 RepID=UPI0037E7DF0A